MSVTCPDGHTSTATDFCDVCGAPIGATATPAPGGGSAPVTPSAPVAPAATPSPAAPATSTPAAPPMACPNCGTVMAADALFCEGCGRDMVTGQLPAPGGAPLAEASAPSPRPSTGWVAEVWVDEEWFAARGEGRCPTVGEPRTSPVADQSLIGRVSKSRGIFPDVDCSADGSVSAKQAVLGFDGTRWTVTDLGSTNGTFVAHPGDPVPTDPIAANQAVELETADRILIGAHTRIVIRAETPGESGTPTP